LFFLFNGLNHKRYGSVNLSQLQVSPGSEGFHCCVFLHKNGLIALSKGSVGIGYEIIAVVDDGVIILRSVVQVVRSGGKGSQRLEFEVSLICQADQITSDFSQQDRFVGHLLEAVDDANDGIDGVVDRVEFEVVNKQDLFGLQFKEVLTAAQPTQGKQAS